MKCKLFDICTTWLLEIKSVTRFLEVTSEPLLVLLSLLSR